MNSKKMPKPQGPCSELHKYPHSNLFKNRELRLNPRDWGVYLENPTPGGVYFIQSGEYVKIGKSKQPKNRVASLQTAHFRKLQLLHVINFSSEYRIDFAEKCLHEIFKDKLTESKNEWFLYKGKLREFIDSKPDQADFAKLANECLGDEIMKKDFNLIFRSHWESDYFCTGEANSIQRQAKDAAKTLEYLQYMLLDIKASKPQPCEEWAIYSADDETKDWDWVEFTELFINASFVSEPRFCPMLSWFFDEKDRLSKLKTKISHRGKLAANDFCHDT